MVFHQPIWKICASQIGSFLQGLGWKFQKKMKPPPRLTWQWKNTHLTDVSIVSPIEKKGGFPSQPCDRFLEATFFGKWAYLFLLNKIEGEEWKWVCRVHKFLSPPELTTKTKSAKRAPSAQTTRWWLPFWLMNFLEIWGARLMAPPFFGCTKNNTSHKSS